MRTLIRTLYNTFFVWKYTLSLHQISDRWDKKYKPQRCESNGKERGGLVHTSGEPKPLYKRNMAEDLKQVADLITANIISTTKEVLTSDEAARYLGISKSCLYKWTMAKLIPHYKSPTGKMCFFNRREIEAWMQSNRVATDDELEQQAQTIVRKGGRK